jgi:predicted peptidase
MKTAAAFLLLTQLAAAKVYDKSAEIAGVTLHYKLILPKDYDATKAYPAVLAFPPGSQTMDMVLTTVERNWRAEAEKRGYIVAVPAAPASRVFLEGSMIFPLFIEELLKDYKIQDGKFAIAGMSSGGLSAFEIAAAFPQYFSSVTGFPGYLQNATPARGEALAKMCIYMHVGELDSGWPEAMAQQARQFRDKGYAVRLTVEKGQSHVIGTLTGLGAARLFDEIEQGRQGCGK